MLSVISFEKFVLWCVDLRFRKQWCELKVTKCRRASRRVQCKVRPHSRLSCSLHVDEFLYSTLASCDTHAADIWRRPRGNGFSIFRYPGHPFCGYRSWYPIQILDRCVSNFHIILLILCIFKLTFFFLLTLLVSHQKGDRLPPKCVDVRWFLSWNEFQATDPEAENGDAAASLSQIYTSSTFYPWAQSTQYKSNRLCCNFLDMGHGAITLGL